MKKKFFRTVRQAFPALISTILLTFFWLRSPFFLDDWHNLWKAHQASWTLASLTEHFTFLDSSSIASWNLPLAPPYHFFRPLVVASFKFDLGWAGLSPYGLHLSNLLFHLIVVLLVVRLFYLLTGDEQLAKWGGLFFALQPQNTVAVVWISGRTETIAAIWLLSALLSYIAFRREKRKRWLFLLLFFQFLSMLTKENTVLLPAMIVAYEWVFERPRSSSFRSWLKMATFTLSPVVLFLFAYLYYRFFIFHSGPLPPAPYMRPIFSWSFLPFVVAKFSYYLLAIISNAFILPLFGTEFLTSHWWALLLLIFVDVVIYFFLLRRIGNRSSVQFGILIFLFSLIPTMTVLTTDLYLYIGSIGFALIIASFFQYFIEERAHQEVVASKKWLRWRLVYLLFFALGFFARGGFYHLNGLISERIYRDIKADTSGKMPLDSTIFLVNMPFAGSHLAPMLRLRLHNPKIHAVLLTLSPEWTIPTKKTPIQCLDERTILLKPPSPHRAFFKTPEEWNLQLLRFPFNPKKHYEIRGARILPILEKGEVVALKVIFKESLKNGKNYLYTFFDDGRRIAHHLCRELR